MKNLVEKEWFCIWTSLSAGFSIWHLTGKIWNYIFWFADHNRCFCRLHQKAYFLDLHLNIFLRASFKAFFFYLHLNVIILLIQRCFSNSDSGSPFMIQPPHDDSNTLKFLYPTKFKNLIIHFLELRNDSNEW